MSGPTDDEVLAALRVLRAWFGTATTLAIYTQQSLPPDCRSRDAYVRRHGELRRAGVPGVWRRGKTLACEPEAWAHDLPKHKRKRSPAPTGSAPLDDLDRELGIIAWSTEPGYLPQPTSIASSASSAGTQRTRAGRSGRSLASLRA